MPEDFAKIVRASNGQQVLVYHEPDTESPDEDGIVAVIHYIASMDFGSVDLKMRATTYEGVERSMESFDQDAADRFIQRIENMTTGISNEVEKPEA